MTIAFDARAVLSRRRRVGIAALPLATAGCLALLVLRGEEATNIALMAAVFAVGVLVSTKLPRAKQAGRIRVDRRGLLLGDRVELARPDIAMGPMLERPRNEKEKAIVRLTPRGLAARSIDVEVEGFRRAELLEALELDAAHAMSSVRVKRSGGSMLGLLVGFGVTIALVIAAHAINGAAGPLFAKLRAIPAYWWGLLATSIGAAWSWTVAGAKLGIGSDGLLIESLTKRRFLSYAEARRVTIEKDELLIWRRRDAAGNKVPPLRLGLGRAYTEGAAGKTAAAALLLRIAEARDARARSGEADVAIETLVARGDRPTRDWLVGLRRMLASADYRKSAVEGDRLWRLVEDAAEEAATRAGAAIALGPTLGDGDRARLRRIAGASASPALRIALEAAADEEAELDALAGLDDAPPPDDRRLISRGRT